MKVTHRRDTRSKAGRSFVTFTDAVGKITRADILEKERLARVHREADDTEKQVRFRWELSHTQNLKMGLDYGWLDQTFDHRGEIYQIVGVHIIKEEGLVVCQYGGRFARMGVP